MVLEIAEFTIRSGQEDEFTVAYGRAAHLIWDAPGCLSMRMTRGIESPSRFVLLVEWENVTDHTEGFRGTASFRTWREELGPFSPRHPGWSMRWTSDTATACRWRAENPLRRLLHRRPGSPTVDGVSPTAGLTRLRQRPVLLLLVAVLVAGAGAALTVTMTPDPPPVATEIVTIDVPAGPGGTGQVRLDATVYQPTATPAPAVLLAHGFGGNKDSVSAEAAALARRGFVVLAWTARGFGDSGGQIGLNSPTMR